MGETLQLVLCICTFFIFFFDPHVCHLKTHVSEYSSEYMYYQNFRVLRGKKNQRNTCISSSTIFFQLTLPSLQWFPQPSLSQGRVKSKPTRANKSHVRLLAIDWLEKANKKHTSKT